jgi:hypothetical protein
MTDDMIALRELLEKGSDTTLLREMIGFAAQRLMELETDTLCGAGHGERSESRTNRPTSVTATAIATGRPEPVPSSCASPSCAAAATSRAFWNHAGWGRRR